MDNKVNNKNTDLDEDNQEIIVSKSAIKKGLHEIVAFGEDLLSLNNKKLAQLPLSDLLLAEIELAKRLKNDNSRRRQMQRIGKLLRSENYDEIQQTYIDLQDQNREHHQSIHPAESWVIKLLDDNQSLAEFIDNYPTSDRQQLAQLIRNSKKEISSNKPSKKQQQRLYKCVQTILVSHLN